MKIYIIASITIIAFVVIYYLTGSLKLTLGVTGILAIYLVWIIGFELGLFNFKEKNERVKGEERKEHMKKTENNPTLR